MYLKRMGFMFKKIVLMGIVLLLTLSFFTACGSEKNNDAELLANAEKVATELADAVMSYDLATVKKYSVLASDVCEEILASPLTEIREEDGSYNWDGVECGDFDGFVSAYDSEMNRKYEKLEITVTASEIYDDKTVLTSADERELLGRDESATKVYKEAVSKLSFEKVASVDFKIVFKDVSTVGVNGETESYDEKTVAMTVWLVLVNDEWRSYSPTLAGTFPPLAHFPRYTLETK